MSFQKREGSVDEELDKCGCFTNKRNYSIPRSNIGNNNKDVSMVITNQADFEKYISCSGQLPVIDFDK